MSIQSNLEEIKKQLPPNVTLVAISKTKPIEAINKAYEMGQRHFGENKVQELQNKHDQLPSDIKWHMIGHLQRNKVKYIAPFVHMIHAVDTYRLATEINKQAKKNNRIIDCLIQFHIATETSKFGFLPEEFNEIQQNQPLQNLSNIKIRGVMGMATFTNETNNIKKEFTTLRNIFNNLKENTFTHNDFNQLSMGMSHDYKIAIEEGSTMVRIGSSIFGMRNY